MNHLDLNTLAAPSFARCCAWAGAVAALCAPMVSMAGFAALGSQQTVDDSSTSNEGAASIAVDASGNHVVVYKGKVGLDSNVYLRRYSAAGQTRGLASRVNSQTSGEGMVLKFSGNGKVYVCSRNRESFRAWVVQQAQGR